jgi:16S rRNA (guanine966-N2)-methyltransferase
MISKTRRAQPSNQLRIIGGAWRGRKLSFPSVEGLRPTPDRVRETVFNWLTGHLDGAQCLDLFAGSGALGFEALSRGARYCCFIDRSDLVNQAIKVSAQTLGCGEDVSVLQRDSSQPVSLDRVFDVVFLDPPFANNLTAPCLKWLLASNLLRSDTLLYLETPKAVTVHDERLRTLKEKTMGDVTCRLLVQR